MKTTIIDSAIWLIIVAILSVLVWGTLEFTSWIRMSGYESYAGSACLVVICIALLAYLYKSTQA